MCHCSILHTTQMMMNFIFLAADAPKQQPPANALLQLLPIVLIFVIMYFLIMWPQRKKDKARRKMVDSMQKGDDVVTIGGIHGKIWQVKDQEIVVVVADDVRLTFSRGAISQVIKPGDSPKAQE